jgi:orotate phosphoribosyltransferase
MDNQLIDILKSVGAVIADSHFVGTSGRHFATYINKDALYPHTEAVSEVGKIFAEKFKEREIEVVVGPALGGIILSQWTAHHLTQITGKEVLGVYTDKMPDNDQVLKRGYDKLVKGKKVLIVEDLTTTGGSVKKVVEAVKQSGGEIVAVSVMANKDPEQVTAETIGAPFLPLAELTVPNFDAAECPLCKNNVPVNTTIGHGKKFLEEQAAKNDQR